MITNCLYKGYTQGFHFPEIWYCLINHILMFQGNTVFSSSMVQTPKTLKPPDKNTRLPQNIRIQLPSDVTSYPRKTKFSATLLWKPRNSQCIHVSKQFTKYISWILYYHTSLLCFKKERSSFKCKLLWKCQEQVHTRQHLQHVLCIISVSFMWHVLATGLPIY